MTRSSASWPPMAPAAAKKRASPEPNRPPAPMLAKAAASSWMRSQPPSNDPMVSALAAPNSRKTMLSWPLPPERLSLPAPPSSQSSPPSPYTVSLPLPPTTVSTPLPPERKSLPPRPLMESAASVPLRESLPSVPFNVAMRLLRVEMQSGRRGQDVRWECSPLPNSVATASCKAPGEYREGPCASPCARRRRRIGQWPPRTLSLLPVAVKTAGRFPTTAPKDLVQLDLRRANTREK